jgi:hypothetical protein
MFRVTWKLTDIDYPACLSHVEFDYYDTVYNESISKQVNYLHAALSMYDL